MTDYNDPEFIGYNDLTPEEQAREDAINDEINEDSFGHIRDLTGEEREKAIAQAEENLAWGYGEGLYECQLLRGYDNDENKVPADGGSEEYKKDAARHKQVYAVSLAAIHDVPKDHVTVNTDGTITLVDRDGNTVNYDTDFVRQ